MQAALLSVPVVYREFVSHPQILRCRQVLNDTIKKVVYCVGTLFIFIPFIPFVLLRTGGQCLVDFSKKTMSYVRGKKEGQHSIAEKIAECAPGRLVYSSLDRLSHYDLSIYSYSPLRIQYYKVSDRKDYIEFCKRQVGDILARSFPCRFKHNMFVNDKTAVYFSECFDPHSECVDPPESRECFDTTSESVDPPEKAPDEFSNMMEAWQRSFTRAYENGRFSSENVLTSYYFGRRTRQTNHPISSRQMPTQKPPEFFPHATKACYIGPDGQIYRWGRKT